MSGFPRRGGDGPPARDVRRIRWEFAGRCRISAGFAGPYRTPAGALDGLTLKGRCRHHIIKSGIAPCFMPLICCPWMHGCRGSPRRDAIYGVRRDVRRVYGGFAGRCRMFAGFADALHGVRCDGYGILGCPCTAAMALDGWRGLGCGAAFRAFNGCLTYFSSFIIIFLS